MRKRLAIFWFLVLTGVAWSQVPRHGSQQQQPPQTKSTKGDTTNKSCGCLVQIQESPAKEANAAKQKPAGYPWGELLAPANIPNWFLTVVAGWAGGMALMTLWAIRDQSKVTKDRERARIVLEVMPLKVLHFGSEDGNEIEIRIENIGPTVAQNMSGWGDSEIVAEGFDPGDFFTIGGDTLGIPTTLRPNSDYAPTSVIFMLPEKWAEEMAICSPKMQITVKGAVEYEDIFGDKHTTPFRYIMRIPKIENWRKWNIAEVHPFSHWSQTTEGNETT